MSNSFNQKNIEAFLTENGATDENARFVSDFMMVAVRPTSSNAEIKDHSVESDLSAYNVVLASGADEIKVAYAVKKLGSGFFEHSVTVTNGEHTYGLNRLIHTPLENCEAPTDAPLSAAATKKAKVAAEEENAAAEEANVVVQEVTPVEVPVVECEAPVDAPLAAAEPEDAEEEGEEAEDAEEDNEDETAPKKAKKAAKKKK